ncbi:MAG: methylmalonyl Co-A mutase-associated GTPase MeaB [Thermoplasmatota archaeon]
MGELAARILAGDRRAAARAITLCEERDPAASEILQTIYPHTGRAHVIGITGPPGSGKSTLADKLIAHYGALSKSVGVIAIDPSSPFTGGAFLGDRIRMQGRTTDAGVFIRSMGSRGTLGGLSRATQSAVHILDALGKEIILVETVGVGQGEIDIVKTADTVVVVTIPGLGDEIQAIKAGIIEIGDVFAVNKADKPDVDRTASEIAAWLEVGHGRGDWMPPVVKTVAEDGRGVGDLAAAIAQHDEHQRASGAFAARREAGARAEILAILQDRLLATVHEGPLRDAASLVAARKEDPGTAAERIFRAWAG